jgi:hypothetical protein
MPVARKPKERHQKEAKSGSIGSRILRALVLGVLGTLLVWQVISRSLVAYLAHDAPDVTLTLSPSDPQALLRMAEENLDVLQQSEASAPSSAPVTEPPAERDETTSARLHIWSELAKTIDNGQRRDVGGDAPIPAVVGGGPGIAPLTRDQLRALTELALTRDPLNARALRVLGQIADAAGDETRAASFMQAAANDSIRESMAVYWLMQKSFEKPDYDQSLYYADALLRTRSQVMPLVLPTLARIAENPKANDKLANLLAENPPWRRAFFSALPRAISDARTPLELLLAIKNTPTPPVAEDIRDYVNFLIEHKFFELAYYTWLQFLPAEQLSKVGLLYNGSFELTPSGLPFDWVIASGAGVTTEILPRTDADGEHALSITFEQGRVEFNGVTQLLLLAPGDYEFKGKFNGELIGRRGLKWRIACAGGPTPFAESAMMIGTHGIWQDIEFSFTVPGENCRAQQLRLDLDARMSSEQLVTGEMRIDELQISRRAAAEGGK